MNNDRDWNRNGARLKKTFGPAWFFGSVVLFLIGLALVLHFFGVSIPDFFKFLGGVLFFVYIPGRSLLRLMRVTSSRRAGFALAMVLGMVASTVVYKFSHFFKAGAVFYVWLALCFVYLLFRTVSRPPRREDFEFRLSSTGLIFFLILLLVFAVLVCDNYRNGLEKKDGSVVINMHYYDGFLRNAVIREVSHSVPPQMPFAAGFPLSYHYGMDLFTSIFYSQLQLGVLDLNHRLLMTFFFFLLALTAFVFLENYSGSSRTALFGTFLVLFGSGGLAYAATYLLGINQWGNIFYSFYFFNITSLNSFLPGLSILFAGFTCLFNYAETRRLSWLIPSLLLLSFVLEFKMFFIGPVFGALLLTGTVMYLRARETSFLKAGIWTAVLALPLILAASLTNRGGLGVELSFRFVDWIPKILEQLELQSLRHAWEGLIYQSRFTAENLFLFPVTVLMALAGSFGVSLLAVPSLFKDFFRPVQRGFHRFFLAVFIGGCVLFFFLVNVRLSGMVRNFTNIYVFLLAAVFLTAAFSDVLMGFLKNKKKAVRAGVLILIVVMTLPNTIRFMWYKVRYPQPRPFHAEFLETADWMNKHSSEKAVIIHPDYLRYACYFTDRRVVLDDSPHSYLDWHLSEAQRRERRRDIQEFFLHPVLGGDILIKYNVEYVWLMKDGAFLSRPENTSRPVECFEILAKNRLTKVKKRFRLTKVFENNNHIVYRVETLPPEQREIFVVDQTEEGCVFHKFVPKQPYGNTPD